jgi:hypothetical protein
MFVLERQLGPFAAHPGLAEAAVTATVRRGARELHFRLAFAVPGLLLPDPATEAPARRDGLWRRTCAELFVGAQGCASYLEWNLSPCGHWNLYRFDGYREGGREADLAGAAAPRVTAAPTGLVIEGLLPLAPFGLAAAPLEVAACAVVETEGGAISHWAALHPAARPDFHDRRGFSLVLPPPDPAGPAPGNPEESP